MKTGRVDRQGLTGGMLFAGFVLYLDRPDKCMKAVGSQPGGLVSGPETVLQFTLVVRSEGRIF